MEILTAEQAFRSYVTGVHSYIDVLNLFISRPLKRYELDTLESFCARRPRLQKANTAWPCSMVSNGKRVRLPYKISLWRPERNAFRFLARHGSDGTLAAMPTYLELSLDLATHSAEEAEAVHRLILRHAVKRGPGKAQQLTAQGSWSLDGRTHYIGGRGRGTQLVLYSGRPSKITREFCAKVEYRFSGNRAIRMAGIEDLSALIRLDHAAFWAQKLPLYRIDAEALGKRLANRHLLCTPEIKIFGSFVYNADSARGGIYLRAATLNDACHPEEPSLIETLRLMGRHGIRARWRLLRQIDTKNILPHNDEDTDASSRISRRLTVPE